MNILTNEQFLKMKKNSNVSPAEYRPSWVINDSMSDYFDWGVLKTKTLDQHKTGYCWLVTYLHCIDELFRQQDRTFIKNDISMSYLIFYDKIEKANWFFNRLVERIDTNISDGDIQYLLSRASGDQGQWTMAANLVDKYGIAYAEDMTNTFATENTRYVNACVNSFLRITAFSLKRMTRDRFNIKNIVEKAMQTVYNVLIQNYGDPASVPNVQCCFRADDYINIICEKRGQISNCCKVELDGNVEEGNDNILFKIPEDNFKTAVLKQVELEGFCWIGCDFDIFNCKIEGIVDDKHFQFPDWFDTEIYESMNRFDLFDYRMSKMKHSIMLCQCRLVGKEKWWLAKNTLGEGYGKNGYMFISDHWLDRYLFQATVNKCYVEDVIDGVQEYCKIKPWELFK